MSGLVFAKANSPIATIGMASINLNRAAFPDLALFIMVILVFKSDELNG